MSNPGEIKFSHNYFKLRDIMPGRVSLVSVCVVPHLRILPYGFTLYDTIYQDGFYELTMEKPHLVLTLYSPQIDGHGKLFTTIRPWAKEKERYYRSHIGHRFLARIHGKPKPNERTVNDD